MEIYEGVTSVGNYAFEGLHNLHQIYIPDSVTRIGDYAFAGSGAEYLYLGSNVTTIGESAFYYCNNLYFPSIPSSVTYIGDWAFDSCRGTGVPFLGNAPANVNYTTFSDVYDSDTAITFYYHEGTTGWTDSEEYDAEAGTWNGYPLVMIPTTYTVKIGNIENGTVTVDKFSGASGTVVTVAATPSEGYELVEILVDGTVIEDNTFVISGNHTVTAVFAEEKEETYFEVDEYKATGTAPVQTDKVFAGWYADETYGQAYTEATGSAHAKFVSKDVFKVKAQVTAGTTAQSEHADIRFVTTVDSLKYKKVGFKITFGGETVTQETSTVYSSIVSSTDGVEVNYTPSDEFHADSKYFVTMVLKDIPDEHFDDTFTVTPYWVTQDGTVVDGVTNELRVSMGY